MLYLLLLLLLLLLKSLIYGIFYNYRFLNNAEIAPHVSGANYTFFVPDDKAFERLGFDKLSDDVMVG